ncbi:hypothetical protein RV13_GL002867 [Enterococcus raffinosus]|nr:hypothetical protein RV13_GL002867 [Enterococcus raffinosus]
MKVFGNFSGFRLAFLNDFYNFLGILSFLTLLEKIFLLLYKGISFIFFQKEKET